MAKKHHSSSWSRRGGSAPTTTRVQGSDRTPGDSPVTESNRRRARAGSPWGRWMILFGFFFYLFALSMTLFEIDAFQTRVGQLTRSNGDSGGTADNLKQRAVLQAVRTGQGRDPNSAGLGSAKTLSERMALRFDGLQTAVQVLEAMNKDLEFLPLDSRRGPALLDAQQERMRGLVERIAASSQDLGKDLDESWACDDSNATADCLSSKSLVNTLGTMEANIGRLEVLLGGPAEADAPLDLEQARKAAESLKEAADTLATEVERSTSPKEEDLRRLVETMRDRLSALRQAVADDLAAILPALAAKAPADAEGGPEAPAPSDPLERIDSKLPPGITNPQVQRLRRILKVYGIYGKKTARYPVKMSGDTPEPNRLDDELIEMVRRFQIDEGLVPVDGDVGANTQAKLNAFVDLCNSKGCLDHAIPASAAAGPAIGIDSDIRSLRGSISLLKQLVKSRLPETGPAGEAPQIARLGRELGKLEAAAYRLGTLRIRAVSAGKEKETEELRRTYDQSLSDLASAIVASREALKESDGVVDTIVDAIGEDDPQAYRKAITIKREFEALGRYQVILSPFAPFSIDWAPGCGQFTGEWPEHLGSDLKTLVCLPVRFVVHVWNHTVPKLGFDARDMATMSRLTLDIMVVIVMGAVGSLIYLIRYLLSQILLLHPDRSPVWRPVSWYVFRPLFGMVVAFAIFLLYKTGQVALGGHSGNVLSSDVNLPILSIFSLFAGLLSWQALEMVESKGKRWLKAQTRENLYASGLRQALVNAGKTNRDLANQIGVTPIQVDRWIAGRDQVTPEMQDRIVTWLKRDRVEIFSKNNPRDILEGTLAWAVGLKEALKTSRAGIDAPRLAQMLEVDTESVDAWIDLKRQVSEDMQFKIAALLETEWEVLFSRVQPGAPFWANGLRGALAAQDAVHGNATALAQAIGSTPGSIRRYMELRDDVPEFVRKRIAATMELKPEDLFSTNRPLDSDFQWAPGLRECLKSSTIANTLELAERIDTEQTIVRAWMEQEVCEEDDAPYCGQVAPETQKVLVDALGCDRSRLFRSERASSDFRWAVMPRLGDLVSSRADIADELDLDKSRIERWLDQQEPIAPATQIALLEHLSMPIEARNELFTGEPPLNPDRSVGLRWAAGLRAAVRDHTGLSSLGALAAQLQVSASALHDHADLLAPVPQDLRDRIIRVLGPTAADGTAIFSTTGPDWSQYHWAPGLREALEQAGVSAEELARALDTETGRVRNWMEQDDTDLESGWAKGKIRHGQMAPAMRAATAPAINRLRETGTNPVDDEAIFSATRMDNGALYARKPAMLTALSAFDGGPNEFATLMDADPARVTRWAQQQERALLATQASIRKVLGLGPGDNDQLFTERPGSDEVLG